MTASVSKVARRKLTNVLFEGFCVVFTVIALVALAAGEGVALWVKVPLP